MTYRFETFRNNKGIVAMVLQSLKVSHLYPSRFYDSPNLKIGYVNYARFPKSGHIYIQFMKG